MTDTIRVWTRKEIEEAAALPEHTTMLKVQISAKLLKLLIEYNEANGSEHIEMLSAYGDPSSVDLRWFKRDT